MTSSDIDTSNPYRRIPEILRAIQTDQTQEGEEVFFVQRLAQRVVCIGLLVSPATLFRWRGSVRGGRKGRKHAIELYVFLKIAVLTCLLFIAKPRVIPAIVAGACLADLCLNLSGFVLLRHYWKPPASATRSIVLLGVNFFELCLEFGILYLSTKSVGTAAGPIVTDPLSILYFSVITSATVGYGDMFPITPAGRCIVILQVVLSLAFVAVVLATFVGKLSPTYKVADPK